MFGYVWFTMFTISQGSQEPDQTSPPNKIIKIKQYRTYKTIQNSDTSVSSVNSKSVRHQTTACPTPPKSNPPLHIDGCIVPIAGGNHGGCVPNRGSGECNMNKNCKKIQPNSHVAFCMGRDHENLRAGVTKWLVNLGKAIDRNSTGSNGT